MTAILTDPLVGAPASKTERLKVTLPPMGVNAIATPASTLRALGQIQALDQLGGAQTGALPPPPATAPPTPGSRAVQTGVITRGGGYMPMSGNDHYLLPLVPVGR